MWAKIAMVAYNFGRYNYVDYVESYCGDEQKVDVFGSRIHTGTALPRLRC